MKFKLPTTFSVLATLGIIAGAWECWTICNRQNGDTFSATLKGLGKGQTFIPLMCGALSKHLWGGDTQTRAAFEMGYVAGEFWPLKDGQDA